MRSDQNPRDAPLPNRFASADVVAILRERGWLAGEPSAPQATWCERAATLLGPQAATHEDLADLLALVFHYEAREIIANVESHAVLSRYAAREVLRQLALHLLEQGPLDSEGFQSVVTGLKESLELRGRDLFHPLRLALAGRAGEGDLDRVILLLDDAAALPFDAPVKSARARIVEFCAALD